MAVVIFDINPEVYLNCVGLYTGRALAAAAAAEQGGGDSADATGAIITADAVAARLAWLPATMSAVCLRLAAFDAALVYTPGVPPSRDTLQVSVAAIKDHQPLRAVTIRMSACCTVFWHQR